MRPQGALASPDYTDLRRLFCLWVGRVIFRNAGIDEPMQEFHDLLEVENMLADTVASWKDKWLAEGIEIGLSKGRAEALDEGRLEGKINNLANNIRSLMETLGLTKEKAMDALKVSEEDRKALASVL